MARRIELLAGQHGGQHVARLNDADHGVDAAVAGRQAGVRRLHQQLAGGGFVGLQVDPVDVGAWRHHGAHRAVAEPHDAGDHAPLVRFDGAVMLRLGHQHLDLLVGDLLLALLLVAQQSQHATAGHVEQPDQGGGDLRQHGHRRRHAHRHRLGIAQRDLLGHQLADDQRNVCDERHHDADADRVRQSRRHAVIDQQSRKAFAERGAGEGARENADQGDADLHRRQEAPRVGAERQRAAGALHLAVDHRLEPGGAGRNDGQLGHCQQAVDEHEDDDRGDLDIEHGASLSIPS